MKDKYLICTHSFSDVITNSSTDIFACNTEKTVEVVLELLSSFAKTIEEDVTDIAEVYSQTVREFYIEHADWFGDTLWDVVAQEYKVSNSKYPTVEDFIKKNYVFEGLTPESKIVVVEGTGDNSIPYWMQEFISSELSGFRIHLG